MFEGPEEKEEEIKSRPMSVEEKQGTFAIIGGFLTLLGFILMSLAFIPEPVDNSNALAVIGLGFAVIGFPFFIFGLMYPYLEAWRKRR